MDLRFVDPEGDGTANPAPYPSTDRTVYNGEQGCTACGLILNPIQALNSDLCPSCIRRDAVKRVSKRMV